ARWPDRRDPFQPDQHLPAAQHRSPALPYTIADEPLGDADERTCTMAARPMDAAESGTVRVDGYCLYLVYMERLRRSAQSQHAGTTDPHDRIEVAARTGRGAQRDSVCRNELASGDSLRQDDSVQAVRAM